MLPPSSHHSPINSQPPAIDFHHDYTTIMPSPPSAAPFPLTLSGASKSLLTITLAVQASSSTHSHALSTPISDTPLVSHLPSKMKTSATSSKPNKNNASSIAFNKTIPKKGLKDLCNDLLNQQKPPELSTKKPQLRKRENQQTCPGYSTKYNSADKQLQNNKKFQ